MVRQEKLARRRELKTRFLSSCLERATNTNFWVDTLQYVSRHVR